MNMLTWIANHGGVVRTADLRAAGFTKRSIAELVAAGRLLRPRGGWVAALEADPHLIAAARAGVVVTCVTQATRLGAWARDEPRLHHVEDQDSASVAAHTHVAAPSHSRGVDVTNAVVHWAAPWIPRPPGSLVDPIENVLQITALCQTFESALAIWESALNKALVTIDVLRRMPLRGAAKELAAVAMPFSDSGLETFVIVRLRWLRVPIVPQAWIAGQRVDFLIGERLVLQIDGGHHVGRKREEDIAHDALLKLMGYHVIRVGYGQVTEQWPTAQHAIMRAIAEGLHLA